MKVVLVREKRLLEFIAKGKNRSLCNFCAYRQDADACLKSDVSCEQGIVAYLSEGVGKA